MPNKPKKEKIADKKTRLLKEFEEYFKEQSLKENVTELEKECFIVDDTVGKNTMILTNHDTGEALKVKIKFVNNELVFTKITIIKNK